jgi:CubicO group peptidase (beta-lactamase class C family)
MNARPDQAGRVAPAALAEARSVISTLMDRHSVPGLSVAVTDSTGELYSEGFGLRDLAGQGAATPGTGYLWFSMSKIATATAALRLADEGSLDLDAPVQSLVPTFGGGKQRPARIRQLLDHTAGASNPLPLRWVLPTDRAASEAAAATAALLARHGRQRRAAGGAARYSNVGYLVVAEAIARASGQPFEDYVRTAVLQPAGMSATDYLGPRKDDDATGYVRAPRVLDPVLRAVLPRGVLGDRQGDVVALESFRVTGSGYGGLVGSVTDAARLVRLHLADGQIDGNRILRPETARLMRDVRTPGRPFDLGLGWFRPAKQRAARPTFVEHWGTGGGFWNAMRLYPALDLGIVVMANTTRPYEHHVLMEALRRAFRP